MDELQSENSSYAKVPIVKVDEREQPDLANQFAYDLVPTYYLDKTKLHEGVASKEKIRAVFDAYLATQAES